jgi:type I restriction enzyme S subunit
MKNWKPYRLGDVLELNIDAVPIEPTTLYKFAGVYCFGKGLFEREELLGANTSYKNFNRLHNDHITISKVKGWEGAIALIGEKFEGMFLSPQYPTFRIKDKNEADIKYIEHFLLRENVWKELLGESVGIGARRNSISEAKFLNLSISLPPLPEQQRIVSKIENVKGRIEEIKRIRGLQGKEISYLCNSIFIDLQKEVENFPIRKVLIPHNEMIQINPDETYKQVTVRMEHKGVLLRGMMKGSDIGSKQLIANENDFIISKIDARNGAMGMIPPDLEGGIVTSDFPLFSFSEEINPKFFYYFSNTYFFDDACKKASEGTTNRKRLKMDKFKNIQIPLPPIQEQNRIVSILDKLNTIKKNHAESDKELGELLPALLDKAFRGEL